MDKTIKDKATPRPWKVGSQTNSDYVYTPDGDDIICKCDIFANPTEKNEANARLIVEAVNAYDQNQEKIAELEREINLLNITQDGIVKEALKAQQTIKELREALKSLYKYEKDNLTSRYSYEEAMLQAKQALERVK